MHAARDVACTSCHKVHTAHDPVRDKVTQSDVCFACHKEQRVQINRPSRHPIREGMMRAPTATTRTARPARAMVRDNVNDTCYTCHMEKRGPFVRKHQPVQENCAICHNPHGTTIASLLRQRPPFLCQQCHEPTSHRGKAGERARTSTGTSRARARAGLPELPHQHPRHQQPGIITNERTFRR